MNPLDLDDLTYSKESKGEFISRSSVHVCMYKKATKYLGPTESYCAKPPVEIPIGSVRLVTVSSYVWFQLQKFAPVDLVGCTLDEAG